MMDEPFIVEGFSLADEAGLGDAIDKIVANFEQKKPFNSATLDLWAENFGFSNEVVRRHLHSVDKTWYLAGYSWMGPHHSAGMHTLLVANAALDLGTLGIVIVVGFGSGTVFEIERGSHRRETRPASDTPTTFLVNKAGTYMSTRPSIKVDPAFINNEATTKQHWIRGGRMIADPRVHWRLETGQAVVFVYMQDVSRREPVVFPADLREDIKRFERESLKVHAVFRKDD